MADKPQVAQIPEVYVDALEGVLFGFPNSRLRFSVVDSSSSPGQPVLHPRVTIAMPTGALLEAMKGVQLAAEANRVHIQDAATAHITVLTQLLGSIAAPAASAEPVGIATAKP